MSDKQIKELHIYLPIALAKKLEATAKSECRSVNQQIIFLVTKALEKKP